MATIYVRSTDGSNADNGSTWALAKATLAGAQAIAGANDTIWVSQVHAESTASSVALAWPSGVKILCGNDAAQPPTALATTATATTTGTSNYNNTGNLYCYGITFSAGTGATGGSCGQGAGAQWERWEQCSFIIGDTLAAAVIDPGTTSTAGSHIEWINCSIKFAATGQKIQPQGSLAMLWWNGGSVVSGSSTPTTLFDPNNFDHQVLIENVDFSNFGTGFNFVTVSTMKASSNIIIRNCKLPASWAGNLIASAITVSSTGTTVGMWNCDSGATNYRLWLESYTGVIRDETIIVRTGGASDGTTPLSWKLTTNSNASYPNQPLATEQFVIWNSTTGSRTVTVEIIHDSVTNLKNNEVWLQVNYLADSGDPKGGLATSEVDIITTATDVTTSSATWTTTGIANPNKQKVAVTFTANMAGPLYCQVMLAKSSKTMWVDPLATVS